MNETSLMKLALGAQWDQLPDPLRAHYQGRTNIDIGCLDIEYPRAMQPVLNALKMVGALINREGKSVSTTVEKVIRGDVQYWSRSMRFDDGQQVQFNSHWVYLGGNRLIEYVNPMLGLCMAVYMSDGKLFYEGQYFVVRCGKMRLRLPEWMLLGHTTIVEQALDDGRFEMDFRLQHPLFGQIYRYSGKFSTEDAGKESCA